MPGRELKLEQIGGVARSTTESPSVVLIGVYVVFISEARGSPSSIGLFHSSSCPKP